MTRFLDRRYKDQMLSLSTNQKSEKQEETM